VDLDVEEGELIALLSPSRMRQDHLSQLLLLRAGHPSEGEVWVRDQWSTCSRSLALSTGLRCRENLLFVLDRSGTKVDDGIRFWMAQVGLKNQGTGTQASFPRK